MIDSPFLDTKEAASYLRLSHRTLEGLRVRGGGPPFHKLGRRLVVYKLEDLKAWAASGRQENTCDCGSNGSCWDRDPFPV